MRLTTVIKIWDSLGQVNRGNLQFIHLTRALVHAGEKLENDIEMEGPKAIDTDWPKWFVDSRNPQQVWRIDSPAKGAYVYLDGTFGSFNWTLEEMRERRQITKEEAQAFLNPPPAAPVDTDWPKWWSVSCLGIACAESEEDWGKFYDVPGEGPRVEKRGARMAEHARQRGWVRITDEQAEAFLKAR